MRGSPILQSLRPPLAGAIVGGLVLGLDELLARLTSGQWIALSPRHTAVYFAVGALVALVIHLGARIAGRSSLPLTGVAALTAAALYVPAVAERVFHVTRTLGEPLALAAALLAATGFLVGIRVLRLVVGSEAPFLAPLLASLMAATGLALNRNLAPEALSAHALALDLAVLLATLGMALVARRLGGGALLSGIAAVAVLLVAGAVYNDLGVGIAAPRASSSESNLLLVVIDTLRQDVFHDVIENTPEGADFRAALGGAVWFSNFIAAAPWTVPSVGSIMSGLYPREHGFGSTTTGDLSRPLRPLSRSVGTLAQAFRDKGYQTAAIVTNPLLHPITGIARGFAFYELLGGPTAKLPLLTALAEVGLVETELYQSATSVRRRARRALADLEGTGRPFFLWLHFMDPHAPLHPHPRFVNEASDAGRAADEILYRNETRYALSEITAIFQEMKRLGVWQRTAVAVLSDHGEMFLSDKHGVASSGGAVKRSGHGHAMYGELVRVPLVIRPPWGLAADSAPEVLASHVDLYGTVAELFGLATVQKKERFTLVPWLGETPPRPQARGRRRAFISANQHGPRQIAMRSRRFKWIHYFEPGEPRTELYDLKRDSRERHDLADIRTGWANRDLELTAWWEALESPIDEGTVELDPELRQRLEALGYLQ